MNIFIATLLMIYCYSTSLFVSLTVMITYYTYSSRLFKKRNGFFDERGASIAKNEEFLQ